MAQDKELPIAVIGGGAVGKSAMTVLMTSKKVDDFVEEYNPTMYNVSVFLIVLVRTRTTRFEK
jgi:GTPase SAR1 family protein